MFKIQKGKVCDFFFYLLDLTEDRSVLLWSFFYFTCDLCLKSFVLINQSSLQTLFLYNTHFITFYKIKLISIVTWLLLVLLRHPTTSKLQYFPVPNPHGAMLKNQQVLYEVKLSSPISPASLLWFRADH